METDVSKKSISVLLDEFVTNQLRCWFAQEDVMKGGTDTEVALASRKAQETNVRRNQLMRAIDAYFDDPNILSSKSYDKSADVSKIDGNYLGMYRPNQVHFSFGDSEMIFSAVEYAYTNEWHLSTDERRCFVWVEESEYARTGSRSQSFETLIDAYRWMYERSVLNV